MTTVEARIKALEDSGGALWRTMNDAGMGEEDDDPVALAMHNFWAVLTAPDREHWTAEQLAASGMSAPDRWAGGEVTDGE